MKSIKSNVRILAGATLAAMTGTKAIRDPRYGEMLPGPEYDRYAELRDYQLAVGSLVRDLESFSISKTEALPRIAALEAHQVTATSSISNGLAQLRAAFETPPDSTMAWGGVNLSAASKVIQAMALIRECLSPLDFGVSDLAYRVPRPVDQNAPKRDPGQPLGTGHRGRDV